MVSCNGSLRSFSCFWVCITIINYDHVGCAVLWPSQGVIKFVILFRLKICSPWVRLSCLKECFGKYNVAGRIDRRHRRVASRAPTGHACLFWTSIEREAWRKRHASLHKPKHYFNWNDSQKIDAPAMQERIFAAFASNPRYSFLEIIFYKLVLYSVSVK